MTLPFVVYLNNNNNDNKLNIIFIYLKKTPWQCFKKNVLFQQPLESLYVYKKKLILRTKMKFTYQPTTRLQLIPLCIEDKKKGLKHPQKSHKKSIGITLIEIANWSSSF